MFAVVICHPMDFTIVIRKYIGGNIPNNALALDRFSFDTRKSGGSRTVPSTYLEPKLKPVRSQNNLWTNRSIRYSSRSTTETVVVILQTPSK